MRVIKFRAKSIMSGRWFYGDIMTQHNMHDVMIGVWNPVSLQNEWYSVDPETVGQFTGLYDKNYNEIYEGDLLLAKGFYDQVYDEEFYDLIGGLQYNTDGFYQIKDIPLWIIMDNKNPDIEVIGNIHENPELLEEKK